MGAGGGVVLRLFNFAIRVLQFVDAAIILAIFSFYLAVLTENQLAIAQWIKATEGLAGAATLYGILGSLFTCCLGGVAFFAALAIFLDVCFVGAMIAIAILTRNGAQSCSGTVNTPLGSGSSNSDATSTTVNLGTACRLEKVAFALAILGVFFFLLSILFQVLLARHHKREKRFGPSPTNNYTSGYRGRGLGFWRRNKGAAFPAAGVDDTLPGHPTPQDVQYGNSTEKPRFYSGFLNRNKNTDNTTGPGTSPYTRY